MKNVYLDGDRCMIPRIMVQEVQAPGCVAFSLNVIYFSISQSTSLPTFESSIHFLECGWKFSLSYYTELSTFFCD